MDNIHQIEQLPFTSYTIIQYAEWKQLVNSHDIDKLDCYDTELLLNMAHYYCANVFYKRAILCLEACNKISQNPYAYFVLGLIEQITKVRFVVNQVPSMYKSFAMGYYPAIPFIILYHVQETCGDLDYFLQDEGNQWPGHLNVMRERGLREAPFPDLFDKKCVANKILINSYPEMLGRLEMLAQSDKKYCYYLAFLQIFAKQLNLPFFKPETMLAFRVPFSEDSEEPFYILLVAALASGCHKAVEPFELVYCVNTGMSRRDNLNSHFVSDLVFNGKLCLKYYRGQHRNDNSDASLYNNIIRHSERRTNRSDNKHEIKGSTEWTPLFRIKDINDTNNEHHDDDDESWEDLPNSDFDDDHDENSSNTKFSSNTKPNIESSCGQVLFNKIFDDKDKLIIKPEYSNDIDILMATVKYCLEKHYHIPSNRRKHKKNIKPTFLVNRQNVKQLLSYCQCLVENGQVLFGEYYLRQILVISFDETIYANLRLIVREFIKTLTKETLFSEKIEYDSNVLRLVEFYSDLIFLCDKYCIVNASSKILSLILNNHQHLGFRFGSVNTLLSCCSNIHFKIKSYKDKICLIMGENKNDTASMSRLATLYKQINMIKFTSMTDIFLYSQDTIPFPQNNSNDAIVNYIKLSNELLMRYKNTITSHQIYLPDSSGYFEAKTRFDTNSDRV